METVVVNKFRMRKETYEKIRDEAAKEYRTINQQMNMICDAWVEDNKK